MSLVVDASAAVAALLGDGAARRQLAEQRLHAPHLVDVEVASALRRHVSAGRIDTGPAWAALDTWRRLGIARHPAGPLLERVWELRQNLSAYDGAYVALAEALGCPLLTADGRIGRAPGVRCPVNVVPG